MPEAKPATETAPKQVEEVVKPENVFSQMKDMAAKYMVPMAESTLKEIAGIGNDATKTVGAFEDYLKTTASGLFPTFAPQIQSGIPTAHLLEPYRQVAKQMLGDEFEPDFVNDIKSAAVLHGAMDEKTGRPVPMTLGQWQQHIMKEPGFNWGYTPQAHERVNTILNTLKQGLAEGGQ